MISEYARIRILTLRVRWKKSRVGQIWSQIEKLIFLEIWNVAWRISMATIRRGTFIIVQGSGGDRDLITPSYAPAGAMITG